MKGKVKAETKEEVLGQFEVRALFKVGKIGTIAGGMVTSGMMVNKAHVRVLREGAIVYEGKIESLKRNKDEVKDVKTGFECGVHIENFNDVKEGDILEAFHFVEQKR